MKDKTPFMVTYAIVTPESAEAGDIAECDALDLFERLRDALKAVKETRTNRVGEIESVEADSYPCERPQWITVHNGMEFETGAYESRSLHIPSHVTRSSARRIARLAGVRIKD